MFKRNFFFVVVKVGYALAVSWLLVFAVVCVCVCEKVDVIDTHQLQLTWGKNGKGGVAWRRRW